MKVDRLPDNPDDPRPDARDPRPDAGHPRPDARDPRPDAGHPRPDAGHPRPNAESTDSPAPDPAPPVSEHHPRPERAPGQERKPDQEQRPDTRQNPASEHPPESSPTQTDSPAHTPAPAEPRSRQEHATPLPVDEASQPPGLLSPTDQEALPTKSSLSEGLHDHALSGSEVSNVQEELPDEAGAIPNGDADRGGMPQREDSSDHQAVKKFNYNKETDQYENEDSESHQDAGHADRASKQEDLPDDMDTSSCAPQHPETSNPDDDIALADVRAGPPTDKWAEHLVAVREGLDSARREGLISKRLYTIDGAGEIWIEERERLHDSIIEDLYAKAAAVPCGFKAIVAGGLGGAGKTTVLTQYAGIDLSQYLMINPDNMKEEMAHRDMIPAVEGLSPMEASELVHEESSYLASQLALRAQADGKNLIWDITMSSEESVAKRINELASAGYTHIDGLFVDISVETSLKRIESRHREGHDKYLAGKGVGGRYVPPEVIKSQEDSEWGSKNMRTFSAIKQRFNDWSIYDNSVDERQPILVEAKHNRLNAITGK